MDFRKSVIGLLALLTLLAILPLGSALTEESFKAMWEDGEPFTHLNYLDYDWYAADMAVDDGEWEILALFGNLNLDEEIVFIKIFAADGGPGASGATLDVEDIYGSASYDLENWQSTVFGDTYTQDTWTTAGYVWINNDVDWPEGKVYVDGYLDIGFDWLDNLNLSVSGEDIRVVAYVPVETWTIPPGTYPDESMANLVIETDDILMAAFDVFQLMIIITAIVMFFFVLVFLWKIFEYFVTQARMRTVR
jgi:hypothetical protein